MKDIAYCNTQFKRFAKYFNGFVEKKQKYYIGFATETSENVWWYDGSKVMKSILWLPLNVFCAFLAHR